MSVREATKPFGLAELYESHGRLTTKMFIEGLSTGERRRLSRCRHAIERKLAFESLFIHYSTIASRRRGRARARAERRARAVVARLASFYCPW